MKLKTRLLIAFFAVILIPFFLFIAAFFGFGKYQIQTIEEKYGITISMDDFAYTLSLIGKSTQTVFEEMKKQAEKEPEMFLKPSYLEQLNEYLKKRYSWLLVRVNGELYYNGSGENVDFLMQELPRFHAYSSTTDGGSYLGEEIQLFEKQLDMELENGTTISAFLISTGSNIAVKTRMFAIDMVLAILVILCFTAGMMFIWIYAGVRKPLKVLSEATHKIRNDDLDFTIHIKGKDELSELSRDFDAMRQRLKDQAEEKENFDRQSKELISNISHDLKTPITAIKGYIEGIRDGVADTPEKMDRYIRTIYNKANDMDRLINELTFYSKIDTNRIPYQFKKINVSEYFDDCAEEVGLELRERSMAFSYINNVEESVQVIADAEQMKRVINNIISNSVKYMDKKKGVIEIRVNDAGDFIQVEIEDNGKGIAAKDLGNIFDRFYRTDVSRNSAQGGSGIGLSIVRKIVEDHGGKIWASSKEGQGTTMYFVIRKDSDSIKKQ